MKFRDDKHKEEFTKKVQSNRGKLPPIEQLMELAKAGLSQTEIAEIYGVTRQAINKLLVKIKKD